MRVRVSRGRAQAGEWSLAAPRPASWPRPKPLGWKVRRAFVSMINVVLVGTNALLRQGLRHLLDPSQFTIVGEARDLASAKALLQEGLTPDLIVADLNGRDDEQDLSRLGGLHAGHGNVRIVVLADEFCWSEMARLLKAGVDGYLTKELSAEALSLSLLLVKVGEKVLPSTLASVLADDTREAAQMLGRPQKQLTEREELVLKCLLNAYSNKHIARALDISEGTVKVHLKSVMKKISAANRTQAALWARNNGIEGGPAAGDLAGSQLLTA